jgi:hypothetical protein
MPVRNAIAASHRVTLRLVELERAVALIAGQAREGEARRVHDRAGQRQGLVGRGDATAVHALVDVDHDPDRAAGGDRGARQLGDLGGVVDRRRHLRLAGEERERPGLLGPDDLVDHEDVVDAGARHHDRLPDRRAADPDRAGLHLHAGDVRALVP